MADIEIAELLVKMSPEEKALTKPFLDAGFTLLGVGAFRAAFQWTDPGWVFKVPLGEHGRKDNKKEEKIFMEGQKEIPLAKCHPGSVLGVEVLFMEKVDPYDYLDPKLTPTEEMLPWTYKVLRLQVGWTNGGVLVAYDFDFIDWPEGATIRVDRKEVGEFIG